MAAVRSGAPRDHVVPRPGHEAPVAGAGIENSQLVAARTSGPLFVTTENTEFAEPHRYPRGVSATEEPELAEPRPTLG